MTASSPRAPFPRVLSWLLLAWPLALGLKWAHASPVAVFAASALAIVPLAGLMGRATEDVGSTMGSAVGGLLNATFGNAAELIIALFALAKGPRMYPLVKASLTGSIIGNLLLVMGFAILGGGMRREKQTFNRTTASLGATMLFLASIGLVIPTLFYHFLHVKASPAQLATVESVSEEIAVILIIVYVLSLVFTLHTHKHHGQPEDYLTAPCAEEAGQGWGRGRAVMVLLASAAGVAVMSELLVGSVEDASARIGLTPLFVGVIVVAIIGNAAEHATAVTVALKDKMDLALGIGVGSSTQVALFVAPVLVFASMLFGHAVPLDLHFTPLEVVAIVTSTMVVAMVCHDGETHWMEGVLMLAVYAILAVAFYHVPPA